MLDVIYDGQCGFCVRALNVCRVADLRRVVRFHDATALEQVVSRFPELAGADVEHAMFVVTADRRVLRGFFGFRRIARSAPLLWPVLPLFYLPGSAWLGPKVYAWVARNRHRFGCASAVCELPSSHPRELR